MPKKEIDLRQQTYDLLPLLVEPTAEEKAELEAKKGLVFLTMSSQSCADIVAGNKTHFWENELEFANSESDLRHFVLTRPVEVGLIEAEPVLLDSLNKPRADGLKIIGDYSQQLTEEFPDFRAIMLPTTGSISADLHYSRLRSGKVLFKNYYSWCLENTRPDVASNATAVFAGRYLPTLPFFFSYCDPNYGYGRIGVAPAIVKVVRRELL